MRVIIIGAGIAGLGAATYFSHKGHHVTVLEASDHIGGRAITLRNKKLNSAIDAGTQFIHSNYNRTLKLIDELGLREDLCTVKGKTRIYDNRAKEGSFLYDYRIPWYETEGVSGNLKIGSYLLKKLVHIPWDAFSVKNVPQSDSTPAYQDNLYPGLINSIIRPLSLVGALSEPDAMEISELHMLRLIRIFLLTKYHVLPGGIASLHEELAKRLNVKREMPVSRIVVESDRVTGVAIAGSEKVFKADHIVVATPADIACNLIPDDWHEGKAFLASVKAPEFVLPTFYLDRPLQKNVWSYMMHHSNDDGMISYLTDASQKNPKMAQTSSAIIQAWICYPKSILVIGKTENEILTLCINEIEKYFPGFSSWIEDATITHHRSSVPFHSVGHQNLALKFLDEMDRKNISFCGDYFSGGFMESALWSAERAASRFA